jgi:hypothetical protein
LKNPLFFLPLSCPYGTKNKNKTEVRFWYPQPYRVITTKMNSIFVFQKWKNKNEPHHLITHATHFTTSGDQPLTMGNTFSISHTVFHITVTLNSILGIKWRSCLISRVNLAPKYGVNVIMSPLQMPQKPLFLYG